MSVENLPSISPPAFRDKRSKSLTRLIDYNDAPLRVIEEPNFTTAVSFKNFKNVYKTSYVQANAEMYMKGKSVSPEKKTSAKVRIETETAIPEEGNVGISLVRISNSPSPQRKQDEDIYDYLKEKKRYIKAQISGEKVSSRRDLQDSIMSKLINSKNSIRKEKRTSLSNLYSFNNELNGNALENKKFIHPTVKKIFRKVVESTEHGSKTNFEALKEAFAIHDPRELRAINRIPMQPEALPDYNEIIKKLENKIVTTFMDKMSLYRKTFTDNLVEMEDTKKYATKKDLGLLSKEEEHKRYSLSVDRPRVLVKLDPLARKKSDIMENNEKLYNRSMEKYKETSNLLGKAHQGLFTDEELDFMNAVKRGSANQIATKLAKSEELIKLRDHLGQTCLHWAVRRRQDDVLVEILGKRGLEFEARDVTGRRAIDLARNMKYYDMLAIMEDFLKEQMFIRS